MESKYTVEDKRKDLIFIDKQRIERVFAGMTFLQDKLSESLKYYSSLSSRRVNREWSEWKNPTPLNIENAADYEIPQPKTAKEMALVFQQSGRAGLMG